MLFLWKETSWGSLAQQGLLYMFWFRKENGHKR
jgi:hypothetical protein